MARGRSSPRSRTTVARRTTAWTTAERANPRIRAHRISQVIDPASDSACPMALIPARSLSIAPQILVGLYLYGVSKEDDGAADDRCGMRCSKEGLSLGARPCAVQRCGFQRRRRRYSCLL